MSRSKSLAAVVVAAVAAGGVGTALAKSASSAPLKATLTMSGKSTYKINRYVQFGARFDKDVVTIRSGGTLTLKNLQSEEPHTFSIVKKSQLPKTTRQIDACKECQAIATAHGVDPSDPNSQPTKPLVDVGTTGFASPGDSAVVSPHGAPGSTVKVKITAKKGSTLNFMCGVHGWMQGKVLVK
jgi:hypothetical protein